MNKVAVCTISSANYFPFAKTMLASVSELHSDCDLFYLLVDKPNSDIAAEPGFQTLSVDDLGIDDWTTMAFVYDLVEFNTSVKPFLLTHLIDQGYQKVIYLDPDVYLFNRLDYAIDSLDRCSIALTPHMLSPVAPIDSYIDYLQWEQSMSLTGIFNLGFIAVAATQHTSNFLSWWQNRCRYLCFNEAGSGVFFDQKWINLVPVFFPDLQILMHPGYNVSVWNLHERDVVESTVNGAHDLVFYHFSSIDVNNTGIISRHDPHIGFREFPNLEPMFKEYIGKVMDNGYAKYCHIPYAFNYYADGSTIDILDRRLFSSVSQLYCHPFQDARRVFYKKLFGYARKTGNKQSARLVRTIASLASLVFMTVGPANYRRLFGLCPTLGRVRSHLFLLKRW